MSRARDLSNNAQGSAPQIIGAKGDLLVGTADNVVTNLAVGTNGQVLTAASGQTSGLQWATPAGVTGLTKFASGSATGGQFGATVTLPVGRFSTAPTVVATLTDSAGSCVVKSITTSSFLIEGYNTTGQYAARTFTWMAAE